MINHRDAALCYHGDGERVDVFNIQQTVLPGDETLHVDVQLIPDRHDGVKALLNPLKKTGIKLKQQKAFIF